MDFLSKNIKYLRQQKKLTQEDIANIVGKARSLVSAWESDDREISTQDIIKLSDYFGIPMDSLVGKDLRINDSSSFNELEILFSKNKDILTNEDKEMIEFIIEKRKREIDKELGENDNQSA